VSGGFGGLGGGLRLGSSGFALVGGEVVLTGRSAGERPV
jgi:hypothetical protein